jgi:amino acid permease
MRPPTYSAVDNSASDSEVDVVQARGARAGERLAGIPSTYGTFFKSFVASGVFALANGLRQGGVVIGLITFVLCGLMSTRNIVSLVRLKKHVDAEIAAGEPLVVRGGILPQWSWLARLTGAARARGPLAGSDPSEALLDSSTRMTSVPHQGVGGGGVGGGGGGGGATVGVGHSVHEVVPTSVIDGRRRGEPTATYGTLAYYALGSRGRVLLEIAIVFSQAGFCGTYLVFVQRLGKVIFASISDCRSEVSGLLLVACVLPVILPLVFIRRVRYLAIPNLLADVAIIATILLVAVFAVKRIITHGVADGIVWWIDYTHWPIWFSTAIYSFEGMALVMPIQDSMQDPDKLVRVSIISLMSITGLFAGFATIVYLAFGIGVQSVSILNAYEAAEPGFELTITVVIILLYLVGLIFTTPIMLLPASRIVERMFFGAKKSRAITWRKNALRTAIMLLIAGVAVGSVDQFSNLIGVIGALGCIPLAVVFPNVCELRIMGDRLPRKTVIFNRVILGVGFVGTAVGTFVAVYLWITSAGEKEPECRFLKNQ